VITCNRCGNANPSDVTNCQRCGAPLSAPVGRNENGFGPRMNAQDQPELPAWLESLRAGERSATPPTSPSSFSAADLVDGDKLPSWMQPDRADLGDKFSGRQAALRPSSFSAPNTDEGYAQGRGIAANSLIDEQSLPSWMQPEKPAMPQHSIAASNLVQPEFVPDWMKTMQPPGQLSAPIPQQQPSQPLQGFAAGDLIDQQSLPEWMQQQNGQGFTPPAPSVPIGYNGQPGAIGQSGLSASSLLDVNALPSWMKESERGGQEQRGAMPPLQPQPQGWQAPEQPSTPSWQPQQQPMSYPTPGGNAQSPSSGLSMSSLVDVNALPEWLRSAGNTQQQQGPMGQTGNQQGYAGPGGYGPQVRVENVRVPSRPRGEVGPNEGSEVAANVFASMLGVASNSPQFPAQGGQQGYPMYPNGQPMTNSMPNQAALTQNTPKNSTGQLGQALQQPQGYMQDPQMGYNNSYQTSNLGSQGNYAMSGSPMVRQPGQGTFNAPSVSQISGQQGNEKPAKKGGLFEAIRNFFFRQS